MYIFYPSKKLKNKLLGVPNYLFYSKICSYQELR